VALCWLASPKREVRLQIRGKENFSQQDINFGEREREGARSSKREI